MPKKLVLLFGFTKRKGRHSLTRTSELYKRLVETKPKHTQRVFYFWFAVVCLNFRFREHIVHCHGVRLLLLLTSCRPHRWPECPSCNSTGSYTTCDTLHTFHRCASGRHRSRFQVRSRSALSPVLSLSFWVFLW